MEKYYNFVDNGGGNCLHGCTISQFCFMNEPQEDKEKKVAQKPDSEKWNKCVDCGANCDKLKEVTDKWDCFLNNPLRGWCPYLAGVKQ